MKISEVEGGGMEISKVHKLTFSIRHKTPTQYTDKLGYTHNETAYVCASDASEAAETIRKHVASLGGVAEAIRDIDRWPMFKFIPKPPVE